MSSAITSLPLLNTLLGIWQYAFLQHAFEAGTVVAVVAGIIGYFVVLRKLSFAAHALSHIGFAGAAGAVLVGLNPLIGLLAFTSGGGLAIAALGKKASSRDVQIGTVLAFMLGLGVLFISQYKGYATEAYSLLFGEILGISTNDVLVTLVVGLALLTAVVLLYRRLLFASLDEDAAEAKGISIFVMNSLFMILLAIAISISVQVVGVLLIFSLLVTPAAIAQRVARTPAQGMIIAALTALLASWLGLYLSFYINYPVSFFITAIVFALYIIIRLAQDWRPVGPS